MKAFVLLCAIRVSLSVVPLTVVLQGLRRLPRHNGASGDDATIRLVTWVVNIASRKISATNTCLVRAIAAFVFLARRGFHLRMVVGVERTGEGPLRAHAWLDYEGRIILGGAEVDSVGFTPILTVEGLKT